MPNSGNRSTQGNYNVTGRHRAVTGLSLLGFIGLCLGIGLLASVFSQDGISGWYQLLNKPSWTPPDRIFGPVWTALYLMMGVAAWLTWRRQSAQTALAIAFFLTQLLLNFLWSILFFGVRSIELAMLDISLLWIAIGITTVLFYRESRVAGLLMVPYWAWVTFATVLNYQIYLFNTTGSLFRDWMISV